MCIYIKTQKVCIGLVDFEFSWSDFNGLLWGYTKRPVSNCLLLNFSEESSSILLKVFWRVDRGRLFRFLHS